ncbi:MAG TPA: hypothetical protein PKB03_05070 [Baekduia sp.]|nr:hypothetical protein [Baekduia sp.]
MIGGGAVGVASGGVLPPGHSPGHVAWVRPATDAHATQLFSGDVLFAGSVGRTDLPFADHDTLMASIKMLLDRFEDEAVVYPGHMNITTLGRERATNPFLIGLG